MLKGNITLVVRALPQTCLWAQYNLPSSVHWISLHLSRALFNFKQRKESKKYHLTFTKVNIFINWLCFQFFQIWFIQSTCLNNISNLRLYFEHRPSQQTWILCMHILNQWLSLQWQHVHVTITITIAFQEFKITNNSDVDGQLKDLFLAYDLLPIFLNEAQCK